MSNLAPFALPTATSKYPLRRVRVGRRRSDSVSVEPDIYDIAYPLLRDVLFQIFDETDNAAFTPEQQERIREAVRLERARVKAKTVPAPETEVGKRIKSELNMPTTLVNRAVREEATRQLKAFKRQGKAH